MKDEFTQIEEATEIFTWDSIKDENGWGRIFHKGECSLFDYDRGFYYVSIYVTPYYNYNGQKYIDTGKYSVRVWYQTIDDGDFGGWINDLPLKDAIWIRDEIKKVYNDFISLPSDEQMNELLKHTGMIIGYE